MKIKFEWEEMSQSVRRAKVIGGWIIQSLWSECGGDNSVALAESMVFIPDPEHLWEIEQEESKVT